VTKIGEGADSLTTALDAAIGMMYDLRVLAVALFQTDTGGRSGLTVGPSFEYVNVQGGMRVF
jgi:hypothetical protein